MVDLHSGVHTEDLNRTSSRLSKQKIDFSAPLFNCAGEAADEANLERVEIVAQLIETLDDMVEVVLESSDTITVVRMSDVELGGHADDEMLDLTQRGRVEPVGKELTGSSIAEIFAHGSDEGVFGEEGVGELFVDLFVGIEKSSGMDERLVAFDTPEGSAGADHQTLLKFVQKISDDDGLARVSHEAVMLCLLLRRVARDDKVFVDLLRCQ